MASEMRRAAQALVEPHPHAIKSDYPPEEASKRLDRVMDATFEVSADNIVIRTAKGDHFVGTWKPSEGRYILEGVFLPPPGTQRLLKGFALGLTVLLAATLWTFLTGQETSLKVSAALFCLFAVLAFPYVIVGLSSQRSGREAAIVRAVQRALEPEIG